MKPLQLPGQLECLFLGTQGGGQWQVLKGLFVTDEATQGSLGCTDTAAG